MIQDKSKEKPLLQLMGEVIETTAYSIGGDIRDIGNFLAERYRPPGQDEPITEIWFTEDNFKAREENPYTSFSKSKAQLRIEPEYRRPPKTPLENLEENMDSAARILHQIGSFVSHPYVRWALVPLLASVVSVSVTRHLEKSNYTSPVRNLTSQVAGETITRLTDYSLDKIAEQTGNFVPEPKPTTIFTLGRGLVVGYVVDTYITEPAFDEVERFNEKLEPLSEKVRKRRGEILRRDIKNLFRL
jgi:hypothetical protein